MQVLPLGLNYTTGDLLISPTDEETFGESILGSLAQNRKQLSRLKLATTFREKYYAEKKRRVVDLALLLGFTDPDHPVPALGESWNDRIKSFIQAVLQMLSVEPVSNEMGEMSERNITINDQLNAMSDRLRRGIFQSHRVSGHSLRICSTPAAMLGTI